MSSKSTCSTFNCIWNNNAGLEFSLYCGFTNSFKSEWWLWFHWHFFGPFFDASKLINFMHFALKEMDRNTKSSREKVPTRFKYQVELCPKNEMKLLHLKHEENKIDVKMIASFQCSLCKLYLKTIYYIRYL